ncbi:MAG: hypothetical protein ACI3V5_05970 [Faecousia sp.]
MKKKTLFKILLVLLPVMAVALAAAVDSVSVVDTRTQTTVCYSYFELIPYEPLQMIPPLAGTLCIFTGILAIGAVVSKKEWWLTGVKWMALAASVAAVAPILMRGETVAVLPNVGVPLLMLCEWLAAWFAARAKDQPEEAPRLNVR